MAKKNKNPGRGGYYGGAFEQAGECEASGSSGRIDADVTASEDSSAPTRKCISLNSGNRDSFGVPTQVLPISSMSSSERKDLGHRLRMELEQIRLLQQKVEMHSVAVPSSSDILSSSNGRSRPRVEKTPKISALTSPPGKKLHPTFPKVKTYPPGTSGRFESGDQASAPTTATVILMKQCEALLKLLMSHKNGWVFNVPVDVVKYNIPDYFTVIKHPMDLGTIKKKLASGSYSSPLEFAADVRTTFTNAMTYNSTKSDVYGMADTLSKYFEVRWKTIEKKLPKASCQPPPAKSDLLEGMETPKPIPPIEKRMISSTPLEVKSEPSKRVMTEDEKHSLREELESVLGEMPVPIMDFLKEHTSNGKDSAEDEIEIDIDELSHDTLFTLRKLLNESCQEKQKNLVRAEPCSLELLNESGLSNSSMQPCKVNEAADEDVDIGENEPPVEIEKDTGLKNSKAISSSSSSDSDSSSSESECDDAKASSPVLKPVGSGVQLDEKTTIDNPLEGNHSDSGLDHVDQSSQQKPSSVESDGCQDGDSARTERPVSPEKLYRAALMRNRFADTILRAQEKTLIQGDKGDPEKLRRQREELELQQKKEKARLQAEAKAAEDARRRAEAEAEAEAAAEAKRKRELEREAARQALLQIERTVEINENSRFLEDLEMLREQLPSSVDETSPDESQDGLGGFTFGGSNALEQLGLYIKDDEEEDEGEPAPVATTSLPSRVNDIEEGEID